LRFFRENGIIKQTFQEIDNMRALSEKVFLQLNMPTDEDSISDQLRIRQALQQLGYTSVTLPLPVLRKLYPMCRYSCIANTSLEGARLLLLEREKLAEARMLAEQMYCVQFASIPDFLVRMQGAKFIPHTDMDRYPTIRQRLQK
jgi:hypothetical protein